MSTGLENKIKFDFNFPNFQNKFGGKTGTVSEQRKEQEDKSNDVANIIGASAEGLDSVTNFVSLFTDKTPSPKPTTQQLHHLKRKSVLLFGLVEGLWCFY